MPKAAGSAVGNNGAAPALRNDAPYNHGSISRQEAEQRLAAAGGADGLFLVRIKAAQRVYALSVMVKGQVKHHLIEHGSELLCASVSAEEDPAAASGFAFNGKRLRQCHSVDDIVHLLSHLKTADGHTVLSRPCPVPSAQC